MAFDRAQTHGAADVIAAVSTAAGPSPRGVVRLSGAGALEVLAGLCAGGLPAELSPRASYRAFDAELRFRDLVLPARVYVMRAPASYTREDVVELHTFGNAALQRALLAELSARGARPAGPGEFTRRAFLNGRIDLAQAEAVESLIHSRNETEHRAALDVLAGRLSGEVAALRRDLTETAALMELSLDFSDQDVPLISAAEARARLRPARETLRRLAGDDGGRVARQAARVVLFGPPNAGKSSLFNALLRRRRAIVSPHPGTTRDTVEAVAALDGLELLLVDTAGLRPPVDGIEAEAVRRSGDSVARADLALCVLDLTQPPGRETLEMLRGLDPRRAAVVLNKSDLGAARPDALRALPEGIETHAVSARTGAGLPELLDGLRARLIGGVDRAPGALMVGARQAALLRQALAALDRALDDDTPAAIDLLAEDVRAALAALDDLTGGSATEETLDLIFAKFCIGK
jgi:tRNA modification GTPase